MCIVTECHGRCQRLLIGSGVFHDGHPVLRQRSRFVGTDNLSAPKSLNGRQLPDNSVFPGHVGDADGEHDGDNGRQSFRYGCHRQAHGNHKRIYDRVPGNVRIRTQ